MSNPLQKLIEKKKKEGKTLSPVQEKAHGNVLGDLMSMLGKSGMSKLGNLKKVTVAADTKPGLAEGLDKAKELVAKAHGGRVDDEDSSESATDALSEEGTDDASADGGDDDQDLQDAETADHGSTEVRDENGEPEKSKEDMEQEIADLKAQLALHQKLPR